MTLMTIGKAQWDICRLKGLHDNLNSLHDREQALIRLALIHTEISEASQVVKRQDVTPDTIASIAEELADAIIRIAELGCCLGLDLDQAVMAKLATNACRPYGYGTPWEESAS